MVRFYYLQVSKNVDKFVDNYVDKFLKQVSVIFVYLCIEVAVDTKYWLKNH